MAHWLYPANTKLYDVFGAFDECETFWPVNTKVEIGDIVYIYLAAPYKQVGYLCEVLEVGLGQDQVLPRVQPFFKQPANHKSKPKTFMKLRPIKNIPLSEASPLAYKHLKENGLTGMLMAARKLDNNPKLLNYIKRANDEL